MASILKECEGVTINIIEKLVLVCGIECNPCNVGFGAWLDVPLLQYSIASILKVCQGVSNHHQWSVDAIFVGLCELGATLAL